MAAHHLRHPVECLRERPHQGRHDASAEDSVPQGPVVAHHQHPALVLYAAALRFFPLHVAHPVLTSGAIAGVALLSVVMFRETLTLMTIAGILLIIAGVVMISVSHQ